MSDRRPVRRLSSALVERLAAGQAIERPASAVKELIDNALDAGASAIDVEVRGGGLDLLRISDDGHGIAADDLVLVCQRYTTSKIAAADDLVGISTLGFRGEALASLVAVADVTLTSSASEDGEGRHAEYRDGALRDVTRAPRRRGTTVAVRRLFATMPGRRKFLSGDAREVGLVSQVVRSYALVHAAVKFTLVVESRLILRTGGSGRMESVAGECWGAEVRRGLLAFPEMEEDGVSIGGWIAGRSFTRAGRSAIVVAINGRPVQVAGLQTALERAYRPLLPRGRHPFAVVLIHCSPEDVDVNVHPAKEVVLMREEAKVATLVGEAARAALASTTEKPADGSWAAVGGQPLLPSLWRRDATDERGGVVREDGSSYQPTTSRHRDDARLMESLAKPRVLGQVQQRIILVEGAGTLYLVDQHRAHERVLYERLVRQAETPAQALLEPIVLELKPHEVELFQSRVEGLHDLGFKIERVGDGSFLVAAVPALGDHALFLGEDDELVRVMAASGDGWRERLCTSMACRSAIRRGQQLDFSTMRALLSDLAATGAPAVCPHGSPLILEVTSQFLERQFGWR